MMFNSANSLADSNNNGSAESNNNANTYKFDDEVMPSATATALQSNQTSFTLGLNTSTDTPFEVAIT